MRQVCPGGRGRPGKQTVLKDPSRKRVRSGWNAQRADAHGEVDAVGDEIGNAVGDDEINGNRRISLTEGCNNRRWKRLRDIH